MPGFPRYGHMYCLYNECKLSVILFISTVCLLSTFARLFLHENSSRQLLQSQQGSEASLKSKF